MTAEEQAHQSKRPDLDEVPFLSKVIATGLFAGYIPWASGTFGSFVGLLFYVLIPGFERPAMLGAVILIGFLAGVYTSSQVAARVGDRLTHTAAITKALFQPGSHGTVDPSVVVIDEIVGMWTSLLFLPKGVFAVIAAFCLFRAFDIAKPFPARQLERIPRGWGIMLDDVSAGIYANVSSQILILGMRWMFPGIV
jgi:phosphatidylglycerophosphatase A